MLIRKTYEAIGHYFEKYPQENINAALLDEYIEKSINDFYEKFEKIIQHDFSSALRDKYKIKKLKDTQEWIIANGSLEDAINHRKMNFDKIDKSLPHFSGLLKLALAYNVIDLEQKNLLAQTHVPEIPEFENFMQEVDLYQDGSLYIDNSNQMSFTKLYELVRENGKIPLPEKQGAGSFILTHEEFLHVWDDLIPKYQPMQIIIHEHTLFLIRLENKFFYYDINFHDQGFFSNLPELIICWLSFHKCGELIREHRDIAFINLQKLMIDLWNEQDAFKRQQLIKNHPDIIQYVAFSMNVYSHPQLQFDKKIDWHALIRRCQNQSIGRKDYAGETLLLKLCVNIDGHYDYIRNIIKLNHDEASKLMEKLMDLAIISNDFDLVKLLHECGAKLDGFFENYPIIFRSAFFNCSEIIRYFLENNIDVNSVCKSNRNKNLVYAATYNGRADILETVLSYNPTRQGLALLTAARFNYANLIRILAKHSWDMNQYHESGVTPLYVAVLHGSLAAARAFIENGANVNQLSVCNLFVICTPVMMAIVSGNFDMFYFLYSSRATMNLASLQGDSLLHIACKYGRNAITHFLLHELKFDPNLPNKDGLTPLMLASRAGYLDVVKTLLNSSRIAISKGCPQGFTALHMAVISKYKDIVYQLCVSGSPFLPTYNGKTPLDVCHDPEIMAILIHFNMKRLSRNFINWFEDIKLKDPDNENHKAIVCKLKQCADGISTIFNANELKTISEVVKVKGFYEDFAKANGYLAALIPVYYALNNNGLFAHRENNKRELENDERDCVSKKSRSGC